MINGLIGIIIQARLGSTRLPNKMLMQFNDDTSLLRLVIQRIKNNIKDLPIILATSSSPIDDAIIHEIEKENINYYRGSESDVLHRFIKAAEKFKIKKIIRVCADNPFLDISALEYQINQFKNSDVDYWCYCLSNQKPTIMTHYGFWTEGVTLDALKRIYTCNNEIFYHEHVTNYIYSFPENFHIHFEKVNPIIEKESGIRLTIDTYEDFLLCSQIYNEMIKFNIPLKTLDIIDYVRNNADYMMKMNEQIFKNTK